MSHFKPSEFDSPDKPGSGSGMCPAFMAKLEAARALCAFPWRVNSGFRTASHNKKVGGVPDSYHARGMAADILCRNSIERRAIVAAAIQANIGGIEVCDAHVHLDDGPPRLWTDKSK